MTRRVPVFSAAGRRCRGAASPKDSLPEGRPGGHDDSTSGISLGYCNYVNRTYSYGKRGDYIWKKKKKTHRTLSLSRCNTHRPCVTRRTRRTYGGTATCGLETGERDTSDLQGNNTKILAGRSFFFNFYFGTLRKLPCISARLHTSLFIQLVRITVRQMQWLQQRFP